MKPNLWQYWQTPDELDDKPGYVKLCEETVNKHCHQDFKIYRITPDNIDKHLPELREDIWELDNPALRADYIRVRLLHKYGGLWLDADTIVMQRLKDVAEKIKEGYDFIGYIKLSHGDNNPSVNFMGATKESPVFERYGKIQNAMLENKEGLRWSDLGAEALEEALQSSDTDKTFFYDESRIQPIPWQEQARFYQESEKVEDYIDEDTLTCMIFNNGMKMRDNIPDVRKLDKEKVKEIPMLLTKLINYSLE